MCGLQEKCLIVFQRTASPPHPEAINGRAADLLVEAQSTKTGTAKLFAVVFIELEPLPHPTAPILWVNNGSPARVLKSEKEEGPRMLVTREEYFAMCPEDRVSRFV